LEEVEDEEEGRERDEEGKATRLKHAHRDSTLQR